MDQDDAERDRLWQRTFDAIYDTLYNEIEIGTYVRRLEGLNTIAIVTACITGTSGIGGLIAKQTIWKTSGGEWIWGLLLVIAAVAGGVKVAFDPAKKLPELQKLIGDLTHLRTDLEEFRSVMASNPQFPVQTASRRYNALTKRCTELARRCPVSILLHLSVRKQCQAETTARLAKYL